MTTISQVGGAGSTSAVAAVAGAGGDAGSGEGTGSLLPEPVSLGGNAAIEIAMLMCKENNQERSDDLKMEDAANAAADRDNAARVQAMEKKASDDATGAWVTGVAGMAAGLLTIGSGVVSDGMNKVGASLGSTNWRAVLAGSSAGVQGVATGLAGCFKHDSDEDDAAAAQAQAAADADGRAYTHADSEAQAAAQSIQQVQQYLAAVLQTQAATASAATGYRS